ncbi:MAG: hypothetical protein ACFFBP_00920 [Promethearchaeota archaeon]
MQEPTEKKAKRLRGIAGVIVKQLKPIENKQEFKDNYSDLNLRLLLNPIDSKYAAIVNLNNGIFEVESIKNEPKENLSKDVLKWNGMLETSTPIFLKISMGEIGLGGQTKLIMTRKMKMKGMTKLLKFAKILSLSDVVQEKPPKEKEKKKIRTMVKEAKTEAIFSRRAKMITAGIIGIILPPILTLLIMGALDEIRPLWELSYGNFGLFYSMVVFNTFNHVSDMILLGYGYWYVFIVWAVTGIFIGLLSRDILKSLMIDLIVIGVNVIIYSISVSISSYLFPDYFIHSLITESSPLYPALIEGPLIFFAIIVQILIQSFALPMLVLFTLIGGLINPRPEYYTVFDENMVKLKQKQKGPGIQKKGMIAPPPSVAPPPQAPKEERPLETVSNV